MDRTGQRATVRQRRATNQTQMDAAFFGEEDEQCRSTEQSLFPEQTCTLTWKSKGVALRDEYYRIRHRVKHVASLDLSEEANQDDLPSEIFPRSPNEYYRHRCDMISIALEDLKKDIARLKERIAVHRRIPAAGRVIKPPFGGKIFGDHLSAVLAQPSIWTVADHRMSPHHQWPTQAELLWNGDNRENNQVAMLCGRYLPHPRHNNGEPRPFQERPVLHQYPFDQVGLIFDHGPALTDMLHSNAEIDGTRKFQEKGELLLGSDLMAELGEWRPSYLTEWRIQQIIAEGELQTGGYHFQMDSHDLWYSQDIDQDDIVDG